VDSCPPPTLTGGLSLMVYTPRHSDERPVCYPLPNGSHSPPGLRPGSFYILLGPPCHSTERHHYYTPMPLLRVTPVTVLPIPPPPPTGRSVGPGGNGPAGHQYHTGIHPSSRSRTHTLIPPHYRGAYTLWYPYPDSARDPLPAGRWLPSLVGGYAGPQPDTANHTPVSP
jgi:hypothetical protein